jgi:predicted DNA-binding transcriptional regulator AlpA
MMPTRDTADRACLLTLDQVAETLAISKRSLERRIACREFPRPLKIGRSSRVSVKDLEGYLALLVSRRSEEGGAS